LLGLTKPVFTAYITIAAVETCLEGEPGTERQGDREDPEFQVLKALDQQLS